MPPKRMWQRMHMDLLKISVPSAAGHEYIMGVVEARSGFVWLRALHTKESAEVASHLLEILLDVGALPEEIVSDRGKEFNAAVVEDLCRMLRTVAPAAYRPAATTPSPMAPLRPSTAAFRISRPPAHG
jgi:Integrase core domain